MTETVLVTEHGEKFHRDQPHSEGTVCGAYSGSKPQRVTRLAAQRMGYAPCSTCYSGVKDCGEYTLFQEPANRWTTDNVLWACYTAKTLILCPVCDELIDDTDETVVCYFCLSTKKPVHTHCEAGCRTDRGRGETHHHRQVVLVTKQARKRRFQQLQDEAPAGPGDTAADTPADAQDDEQTAALVKAAVQGNQTKRRVLAAVTDPK